MDKLLNVQVNAELYTWLLNEAERHGQGVDAILNDCLEARKNGSPLPLSEAQIDQYQRDGCLLVSGLIPDDIAAKAEAAMWRCTGFDPDHPPTSWEDAPGGIRLYNEPELVECYTLQCLAAAAQLTGDELSTFSKTRTHPKTYCAPDFIAAQEAGEDVTRFFRWDCVYAINVFPGTGEWNVPSPHIDHSLPEHHHKTTPPVFRLGALVYLSDVEHHGGGTLVWHGSHRKLEAIVQKNPSRYEYRCAITNDLAGIDLGEPFELTPKRGDVLFLHHLCAHSGSLNLSNHPRLALNMKW